MTRRLFVLAGWSALVVNLLLELAQAQTSANVKYEQHWRSGDSRDPYGEGEVRASDPTGQSLPADVTFMLRLDANSASPARAEWKNGEDSKWDIVRREPGGTWTTVERQKNPAFNDNPGGYLEVTLSLPLYTTNGLEKKYEFEIYGTVAGLNVSPPDLDNQAMLAIPGTVTWTTDSSGQVTACTVTFGTVVQTRGLNNSGGGGAHPRRKARPQTVRVFTPALEIAANASDEAERNLLKSSKETAYTSHFNFDNRVFSGDPNPPRTPKYGALVECVLASGERRTYSSEALREIPLDDWRVLQVDQRRVHVVRCRFWWRLSPRGRRYNSGWVRADEGNYIVYAFLVWHGNADFDVDTVIQEPLPDDAPRDLPNSRSSESSDK